MSAEIKKYKVRIFGELYSITSDEEEEFVLEVVSKVDSLMKEISIRHSMAIDTKKIAVLAAIKMAQELLEINKEKAQEQVYLEKILMRLYNEEASL